MTNSTAMPHHQVASATIITIVLVLIWSWIGAVVVLPATAILSRSWWVFNNRHSDGCSNSSTILITSAINNTSSSVIQRPVIFGMNDAHFPMFSQFVPIGKRFRTSRRAHKFVFRTRNVHRFHVLYDGCERLLWQIAARAPIKTIWWRYSFSHYIQSHYIYL